MILRRDTIPFTIRFCTDEIQFYKSEIQFCKDEIKISKWYENQFQRYEVYFSFNIYIRKTYIYIQKYII